MYAEHLRVDYLKEPIGFGNTSPRFYWHCCGGTIQTAYQIIVMQGANQLWDSGKIMDSSMSHIRYAGAPLKSRARITWKVRLWDENDIPGDWSESSFEMGLLLPEDWRAKWISGSYKPSRDTRQSVDYFRKKIHISKVISRARLYASARGIYDIHINGKRIEDFILAPGMTDYRKRIQYQTYDVTDLVSEHTTIDLRLADGWYRGSSAAYGVTHVYGDQTSIIAQLEVFYDDGTKSVICTDESWCWCNDGPIRYADLKDGEVFNAQMVPSYKQKALVVDAPKAPLVASDNVYVKEFERFSPRLIINPDGSRVLDFGQNLAGYVEFTVQGQPGEHFRLICGEIVDEAGHVDLSGIQETIPAKRYDNMAMIKKLWFNKIDGPTDLSPKQEILFTCSGGEDHYKTSFAIFGFRYIQIVGDIAINPANFTSIAVYSDLEQTGDFTCSNELINQLLKNTRWSMKSNYLDLPTDCPTRERLGWSGDAQIFFNTGAYLMDVGAFFQKWMRDMQDAQYNDGIIPGVFPYQGFEMMYRGTAVSVGFADAVYLIPWRYYLRYGDRELLAQCWPMIEKYAGYLMKHLGMKDAKAAKKNPYNAYTYEKGVHLGEWLEAEEFQEKISATNQPTHTEECTAYLHYAMSIFAKIAELMGEEDKKETYQRYAAGAKEAYNHLFVRTGTLDTDRQAKLVRPLALGLLEDADKLYAQKRLNQAVENRNYHVATGFLSTAFLLPMLTEAGFAETAYKMLENTEKPGWLGEILDGATTIWENWDGTASRNHYSPGAVCMWLFEYAAGIRPGGERHFVISPVPGGTLCHAEGSYNSLYGKIVSRWEKSDEGIIYTVTVPANCTAELVLPNGEHRSLTAGSHTIHA